MPPANVYGQPNVAEQKTYTGNEYEDEPPLLEGKYWIESISEINWLQYSNIFQNLELIQITFYKKWVFKLT